MLTALPLSAADVVAIKAQHAYTISGDALSPAVLLITDGTITAIGKELAVPDGAKVISAHSVMPGIIDAAGTVGLTGSLNEESSEITPSVLAADCFDGTDRSVFEALSKGITREQIAPGNRNVVGGLCALVSTYGGRGGSLVINKASALKAVFGPEAARGNSSRNYGPPRSMFFRRPTTRMAVVQAFEEAFRKALDKEPEMPEQDLKLLKQVLSGKLPLFVHTGDVIDIRALLKQARQFKFRPVIEHGWEAYKEAEAIAEQNIPVVLTPSALGLTHSPGGPDVRLDNAAVLQRSGVKIALSAGDTDVDPLFLAAMSVRGGLDKSAALKALTLWPAEILGINKEYGSLEKGKKADIVILSNEPFSPAARVVQVIGAGKVVFPKGER